MSEHPLSLKDEIRRRVRASEAALDRHPDAATWVAYCRRQLPEGQAAALASHLAICSACCELVLDFEAFQPEDEGAPDEEPEESKPAPSMRFAAEAPPTAEAPVVPFAPRRRVRGGGPRQGWLVAASLSGVLVSAFLAYQAGLRSRPSEPRKNVPLFDLQAVGSTRDGAQRVPEIRLPEGVGSALLLLNPASDPTGKRFGARIVNDEGTLLWYSEGLTPVVGPAFTVELPRGFLPPGRYRLELLGLDDDGEKSLGTFLLAVPSGP